MFRTIVAMLSIVSAEKIIASSKGKANPAYLEALEAVKTSLVSLRKFC